MGTTTTTNLALIKPDSDEYIKANLPTYPGWAVQNAANMDKLDTLFRATSHSWTPTFASTLVNPVLGAGGYVEGKYMRIFPRMVVGYIRLFTGDAGFSPGTGAYVINPPVAIAPELATFNTELPIGKACFYDISATASSSAFTVMYMTASNLLSFKLPSNDLWTGSSPITLEQSDRISCYFMYPTSVA
jgi:hypothetical protein